MKRLVLHVGAPKTGSSLQQKALLANADQLADHGYATLVRHHFEKGTGRAHRLWRSGESGLSAVKLGFERLAPQITMPNAVISHEDLLGRIASFEEGRLYDGAADVLRIAQDVLQPEEISVILYVRRQDRFLESVYLQRVRVGWAVTFDEYMAHVTSEALQWDDLVRRIQGALPQGADVHVRYFETIQEKTPRQYCSDFFRLVDPRLPRPKLPFNTKAVNRGYSNAALKIALAGNAVLDTKDKRTLRAFLDENFSNVTHPKPVLLTEEHRKQILSDLNVSNTALHALTGESGPPRYVV
ncbi:hypothetical protein [Myceligenerans indicum]|uniref:Sulfotransferase family protein n=1 Tax=Myceligenerans indicum TaxID=2593663 RepID=A0ABS1LI12_9MICO|nr:hypothetical protein [Myceligenerans indicum]MBL0885866.1 hypothetical protein [Myceligenerans indicum]